MRVTIEPEDTFGTRWRACCSPQSGRCVVSTGRLDRGVVRTETMIDIIERMQAAERVRLAAS